MIDSVPFSGVTPCGNTYTLRCMKFQPWSRRLMMNVRSSKLLVGLASWDEVLSQLM